jgi:threonine dehydratase
MSLPTLAEIEEGAALVHQHMRPTPEIAWPLLAERLGTRVVVKHENATPIGAFKVRGGITYMDALRREMPDVPGVVTATRGNHGQSVARAATAAGLKATIYIPHGNSVEKNAAMRAFGAELVEEGEDFQACYEACIARAEAEGLHLLASFHPWLLKGVASYGYELMTACPDLDVIYVPIGLGSGVCSTIAVRDALGLKTEVVGVVSENAAAYALSFAAGEPVSTNSANTMADGMACRVPVPDAVAVINKGAARVVQVSDDEIKAAMRAYYTDCHQIAEGAGAAPLAAAMQERGRLAGKNVGLVLSGGNVDMGVYSGVLGEG